MEDFGSVLGGRSQENWQSDMGHVSRITAMADSSLADQNTLYKHVDFE